MRRLDLLAALLVGLLAAGVGTLLVLASVMALQAVAAALSRL